MGHKIREAVILSIQRGRGRPKLDTVRVECMVPRDVYDKLVQAEERGEAYRTRVAASVLCAWADGSIPVADSGHQTGGFGVLSA
jgi:hypothetical protein